MTASTSTTIRRADRVALAVLGLALLFAGGSQIVGRIAADGPSEPGAADDIGQASVGGEVLALAPGATDLERIRANVDFWSERARANPRDFVSSTRWAASEIDLARATSDVTRYVAANEALDTALAANPDYRLAKSYRGAVLVALHEFAEARTTARTVLANNSADPAALATLGDAALALGDMDEARGAYQQLSLVADSAAARVRRSHLAFVDGDPAAAVEASRSAVTAAVEEQLEGTELAWYRCQLGDTLAATGDLEDARASFEEALRNDLNSPLAHWGLARIAAVAEDWDDALDHLDAAIAVIPSPEYVARRADVYRLRGAPGDDRREREDRRTVLAIGQLAGEAAGVYDRTLSLYLSSTGEDPARALRLAEAELVARKDIYGYDALAWALLANGRADEARAQMAEALALGTGDAKLLYHAGMVEAALGNDAAARGYLEDALATDPSFDPLAARTARATLAELD
jgi:tetratricopeptide (TPR) repeat protein